MKNSQLIATLKTHAYFYLIREREFAIRGEDVYKLGITAQLMDLNVARFRGYKKGSELIMITECPMAMLEDIEKSIKELFCKRFVKHDDGFEYFTGNHRQMANLIYKACDNAWTDEQQQIKKDTLKSVLQLIQADNKVAPVGPVPKEADAKTTADDAFRSAAQPATITETIINSHAEKAADEASRTIQDEKDFTQWFENRLEIKADSLVKQAVWYVDYRSWAARSQIIPLTETAAVATFKRLYGSKGVSVGNKTYGIKLISSEPSELLDQSESSDKCPEISNMEKWLDTVAQAGGTDGNWVSGRELFHTFVKWITSQNLHTDFSVTKFGTEVKKQNGVHHKRSNGSRYRIVPDGVAGRMKKR